MKNWNIAVAVIACLIAPAILAGTPRQTTDKDSFVIVHVTALDKANHLYGVRCKDGNMTCEYDFKGLCRDGTPYYADPHGFHTPGPGWANDNDGTPVRLFVCE